MPEGDTLFKAAAGLRPWIAGKVVRGFESPAASVAARADAIVGSTIERVSARGKHLLVDFSCGLTLRTHLRMTGSWHLYRPGEAWRKPRHLARVVMTTDEAVAVCFNAPDVEVLDGGAARKGGAAAELGPDLLDPQVTDEEVAARWRSMPDQPIGVSLMRQHLAAGIGNVYKSEVLFVRGIDPFVRAGSLSDEQLLGIAATARDLMRRNLGAGPRRTRAGPGPRLWVYGRSGKRCLRCGTEIRMRRQGVDGRSTYFCPGCQR